MKKIKRRLLQRWHQFKKHPVTKGNALVSIFRYVCFNLIIRMFSPITYNWIGGLKFIVRKGDAGIIGNIYFGLYEFEESIFLLHFLNKNDLFLDVGANVGHFSLLMSGIIKCNSIAIEPVPETFRQLKLNIALNRLEDLIEIKNIGVSNKEDILLFSSDKGTMNRIVEEDYSNSVSVKVIILELNQSGETYKVKDKELFEIMTGFGFEPIAYNYKLRSLKPLTNYNIHKFNTIFIRDKEFVSNRLKNGNKIKIRKKYF